MYSRTYYASNPTLPGSSNNLSQSLKKSVVKVKEMTQNEFYMKRLSKMQDILHQKGYDLNIVLSEEELINLVDSLGKEPFDREIAAQLFEKIPVSENPQNPQERFYALQDFVDTHIKAEYLLILQAEETENELNKVYAQIDAIKQELHMLEHDPLALENSNSLKVEIFEVICEDPNYIVPQGGSFSALVVFNNYKYETDEEIAQGEELNLKFNRAFHLKVNNPQETIKILLRDYQSYANDPNYKDLKCTLTLDRFEDQEDHNEWFNLYDQNNKPTKFKVHAAIHWQFAKASIHQETLKTLVELEDKLNENKDNIELSLKALVQPFAKASATLKKSAVNSRTNVAANYMQHQPYGTDNYQI